MATITVPTAKWGFFPLDEQLELWDKHYSEAVAKQALWLSGLVDFEQAAEVMEQVGQVSISTSSVWRHSARWAQRGQEVEAAQQAKANALPQREEVVAEAARDQGRMGAAMDGAMVHIRGEGWKELKVGCVFDIEVRPTFDKKTEEWVDLAHALHNTYVAHLGEAAAFGQVLWAEAQARHFTQACQTQVLGDGSVWIWNLVKQHFYDSVQTVDWYHATEHLAEAARLLEGEGTPQARKWYKARETRLYEGEAYAIAQELFKAAETKPQVAKELSTQAGYFETNQRRMQYMELREDDWLIGSGMVESGCKQFRARFVGSGMRWSRAGAERLVPVRAAIMSRRFDAFWQAAYNSPQN